MSTVTCMPPPLPPIHTLEPTSAEYKQHYASACKAKQEMLEMPKLEFPGVDRLACTLQLVEPDWHTIPRELYGKEYIDCTWPEGGMSPPKNLTPVDKQTFRYLAGKELHRFYPHRKQHVALLSQGQRTMMVEKVFPILWLGQQLKNLKYTTLYILTTTRMLRNLMHHTEMTSGILWRRVRQIYNNCVENIKELFMYRHLFECQYTQA